MRWDADRLDAVIGESAATGYGLTLGIHSRIDETVRHILARLKVGNSYVNRSMVGAVVGVQPFGGEALSGIGPKAGGPATCTVSRPSAPSRPTPPPPAATRRSCHCRRIRL